MNGHDDHRHEDERWPEGLIDQAFGDMVRQDPAGPDANLLVATRSSMRLALARRRRRRWVVGVAVGCGSAAAGLLVAVALRTPADRTALRQTAEQPHPPATTTTELAEQTEPSEATPPRDTLITQADREQIRRSLARMTWRRTWDDPGGAQSRELESIRRRIRRLSKELSEAPRSTQPAGSTRGPARTKEVHHV